MYGKKCREISILMLGCEGLNAAFLWWWSQRLLCHKVYVTKNGDKEFFQFQTNEQNTRDSRSGLSKNLSIGKEPLRVIKKKRAQGERPSTNPLFAPISSRPLLHAYWQKALAKNVWLACLSNFWTTSDFLVSWVIGVRLQTWSFSRWLRVQGLIFKINLVGNIDGFDDFNIKL